MYFGFCGTKNPFVTILLKVTTLTTKKLTKPVKTLIVRDLNKAETMMKSP